MKENDQNYVTRKVNGIKTVEVYELGNGGKELIDTIQVETFNKKDIIANYKLKEPYVKIVKTEVKKYRVPVDVFMQHAELVVENEQSEN